MSRNVYTTLGGVCALLILVAPLLAQRDEDTRRPRTSVSRFSRSREARAAGTPKIIEWGYDQPNPSSLHDNIAEYEKAPFDGVVLGAYGWEGKRQINFAKTSFGREAYTKEQFQTAVNQLRGTHFKKFTDNFLRFNVEPGDVDWFDDAGWSAIVKNAAVASWICKEGHLKGIMFDTEQYGKRVFYYQNQPGKGNHTFEEYRDMARKRGHDFGAALVSEKSDITVLFTYATSFMILEEKAPAPFSIYGLLPPFIDGMMEATTKDATFVDALELAYPTKDKSHFEQLHQIVADSKKFSMIPDQYSDRMQVGFGLWLDKDYSTRGWDPDNTAKNYFQPDEFENALKHALATTDKYVWVYTEKVNWYTGKGMSDKYRNAVANARASVHSDK
ncbi:MAG TPA: hypothetical protein VKU00_14970 [Chthonomonadaceae bacterium]|nr:hypothetical protein [Chthonomonadaceae bacterium]